MYFIDATDNNSSCGGNKIRWKNLYLPLFVRIGILPSRNSSATISHFKQVSSTFKCMHYAIFYFYKLTAVQ